MILLDKELLYDEVHRDINFIFDYDRLLAPPDPEVHLINACSRMVE